MSLVNFSQIKGGKQLQDNVDKKANITDVYNVDSAGKKTALYRKNTDKIVLEDLDKSLQDTISQPFTPRKINLVGNASGSATYDGLNDVNIDTTINESEHAVTADSADKLSTSKKINLTGNATGSTTFDGSTDANINVTVNESKHAATADKATTATNATNANHADNANSATKVNATAPDGGTADLVFGIMADNDSARIRVGGKDDDGWLEIATSDNGNEPIYARQYSGSFRQNDAKTVTNEAILLDGNGNTKFPHNVTADSFTGSLNGNADTATANKANTATNATHASSADSATLNKAGYPLEAIVAKSIGKAGYIKYASGLIIQWGYIHNTAGSRFTITYPITFVNEPHVLIVPDGGYNSFPQITYEGIFTSKMSGFSKSGTTINFVHWFAIGY